MIHGMCDYLDPGFYRLYYLLFSAPKCLTRSQHAQGPYWSRCLFYFCYKWYKLPSI